MHSFRKSILRLFVPVLAISFVQPPFALSATDLSIPTLSEYMTQRVITFTKGESGRYGKFRDQTVSNSLFDSIDFLYSEFETITFDGSVFENVNFRSAIISGSSLRNARFSNSTFDTHIVTTDLTGADFSKSSGGIYFRITDGQGTNFSNINLGSSSFRGADLRNAIFRKSTANGATFDDADLTGADLTDASFEFSTWKNVTCPNGQKQNTPCPIPSSKKKTIWCKKGTKKIKVSSSAPKCPRGYKKTNAPSSISTTTIPKAKSKSTTCVQLRAIYSSAYFASDAVKFEAEMNKAVVIMRRIGWGATADSIINFTLQGLRSAALAGIASYLRAYNCA